MRIKRSERKLWFLYIVLLCSNLYSHWKQTSRCKHFSVYYCHHFCSSYSRNSHLQNFFCSPEMSMLKGPNSVLSLQLLFFSSLNPLLLVLKFSSVLGIQAMLSVQASSTIKEYQKSYPTTFCKLMSKHAYIYLLITLKTLSLTSVIQLPNFRYCYYRP